MHHYYSINKIKAVKKDKYTYIYFHIFKKPTKNSDFCMKVRTEMKLEIFDSATEGIIHNVELRLFGVRCYWLFTMSLWPSHKNQHLNTDITHSARKFTQHSPPTRFYSSFLNHKSGSLSNSLPTVNCFIPTFLFLPNFPNHIACTETFTIYETTGCINDKLW